MAANFAANAICAAFVGFRLTARRRAVPGRFGRSSSLTASRNAARKRATAGSMPGSRRARLPAEALASPYRNHAAAILRRTAG